MKVYVLVWIQSYDGDIFKGVFKTQEKAEAFVEEKTGLPYEHSSYYVIEEYELDGT